MRKHLILIFLILSISVYSQRKFHILTPQIATKLSYLCNSNERAYSICANILLKKGINSDKDIDIRINNLSRNIPIAEEFVIQLYSLYGVDNAYFALKNLLTLSEIKKCENVWELEYEKREREIEYKRMNWNLETIDKINANYVFGEKEWSYPPKLNFDSIPNDEYFKSVRENPMTINMDIVIDTLGIIRIDSLVNSANLYELNLLRVLKSCIHTPGTRKIFDSESTNYFPIICKTHLFLEESVSLANDGFFYYKKSKKQPFLSFGSENNSNKIDEDLQKKISTILDADANMNKLSNKISYKVLVSRFKRAIRIRVPGSESITYNLDPIYRIEVKSNFKESKFILWSR